MKRMTRAFFLFWLICSLILVVAVSLTQSKELKPNVKNKNYGATFHDKESDKHVGRPYEKHISYNKLDSR